jgi:ABC-type uncharacterized transport system substrate-binding protein
MRRRARLIGLMVLIAAILPMPSRVAAQDAAKAYRIGYLGSGPQATSGGYAASFRDALRKLGYVEGRNIEIDYRWAEGRFERLPGLIDDLIGRNPQLIISFGGAQAAKALKSATTTVPVVFLTDDPVAEGIVDSLARPGGNMTGVSVVGSALDAKRLELIKEALPQTARLAVLRNQERPGAAHQLEAVKAAGRGLGFALTVADARSADELDRAFSVIADAKPDALLVLTDPMLFTARARILDFAARQRLPASYFWREFVAAGGLMSYGASISDMHRRMAPYVDKILKGANPAELPVEQPTTFELVVNLKTAGALGLTLPVSFLARADEVIE